MSTKNVIAAAALFIFAGAACAADAPATTAATSAAAASSPVQTAGTSGLNLPALGAPSQSARAEVKAEAADFVRNYKTTLSIQLDQSKHCRARAAARPSSLKPARAGLFFGRVFRTRIGSYNTQPAAKNRERTGTRRCA